MSFLLRYSFNSLSWANTQLLDDVLHPMLHVLTSSNYMYLLGVWIRLIERGLMIKLSLSFQTEVTVTALVFKCLFNWEQRLKEIAFSILKSLALRKTPLKLMKLLPSQNVLP